MNNITRASCATFAAVLGWCVFARVADKPVVWMYTLGRKCVPCAQAEDALGKLDLPFTLRTAVPPDWVESVPTFHWDGKDGKPRLLKGWHGSQRLLKDFSESRKDTVAR